MHPASSSDDYPAKFEDVDIGKLNDMLAGGEFYYNMFTGIVGASGRSVVDLRNGERMIQFTLIIANECAVSTREWNIYIVHDAFHLSIKVICAIFCRYHAPPFLTMLT